MKQIHVGTFSLGREFVELYATTDLLKGGEFYFQPEKDHIGRIKVQLDTKTWADCVEILLHEALEYSCTRNHVRFESCDPFQSGNHEGYLFVLTHLKFGSVCCEVAHWISCALPPLADHWNKMDAKRKK